MPVVGPAWSCVNHKSRRECFPYEPNAAAVPATINELLPSQAGLRLGRQRDPSADRSTTLLPEEVPGSHTNRLASPPRGPSPVALPWAPGQGKTPKGLFPCWRAPGCSHGAEFPSQRWEKLLGCIKYLGFVFGGGWKERGGSRPCCTR